VKDPTPITQLGAKTGVQGALAFEKTLILRGMLGGGVAGGPEKHGEENRQ
jgi:cytoskeletal protein CcmA (bactofilin family)